MNELSSEIVAKVTVDLIEDAIRNSWDKIKHFFVDLNNKESVVYGAAYEKYLRNTYQKFSKIKTIIYRRVPKDLYSFYECIGLLNSGNTIDTSNINNILNVDKKIIVTGTGGIGKTMLFKHLFIDAIKNTNLIPVLIELRALNNVEDKSLSLKTIVYKTLVENGFNLSEDYFEYSLQLGSYVILLDGFDEINKDKMSKVASEIKSFSSEYNDNSFIVSSRPLDLFIGWNDFVELSAMSLSKEQALSLINKIEYDETVKEKFYRELEESLYDRYKSFASNPLLLNIMLLTYNNHASFPDNINEFYEQAFATLFNMHDATKDSYVRDIRSELGCDDFKSVFAYICFKSYFRNEYEFSEVKIRKYINESKEKHDKLNFSADGFLEDLTSSVCMLVKEGLDYCFSHRSFQEYFAAWYTCKLTDDIQSRLLTSWLKESHNSRSDAYFEMLFNMQGEKVNKIIFSPGLKKIKSEYENKRWGVDFLNYLFDGIMVKKSIDKDEKECNKLSLLIKDDYLCSILILTCRLNKYDYQKGIVTECDVCERDVSIELLADKFDYGETISFEDAVNVVGESKLLNALKWFENQVLFGFDILETCQNDKIGNKRRVLSILDEL